MVREQLDSQITLTQTYKQQLDSKSELILALQAQLLTTETQLQTALTSNQHHLATITELEHYK